MSFDFDSMDEERIQELRRQLTSPVQVRVTDASDPWAEYSAPKTINQQFGVDSFYPHNSVSESQDYAKLIESNSLSSLTPETSKFPQEIDPWTYSNQITRPVEQPAWKSDYAAQEGTGELNLYEDDAMDADVLDVVSVLLLNGNNTIFGHLNYSIKTNKYPIPVVRRYSDFIWLQDLLLKRYPFRIITALPPKKTMGVTPDFIEHRRRGLARFITSILNHSVISLDPEVEQFFTFEGIWATFTGSKSFDHEERIVDREHVEPILYRLPQNFDELLSNLRANLISQLDGLYKLATLVERQVKREEEFLADFRMVDDLMMVTFHKDGCINRNCKICERAFEQAQQISQSLGEYEEYASDEVLKNLTQNLTLSLQFLESLKGYRDILAGFQIMMHRRDIHLVGLPIPSCERRIAINKERLSEATAKSAPLSEIEKLVESIREDEKEIEYLGYRADFIQYCVWKELGELHRHKARLSKSIEAFFHSKTEYASKYLALWSNLSASLMEIN